MIPAGPVVGDTLRYVPGAPQTTPKPAGSAPAAAAAPQPRKGIFGLHPAAIAFGLIVAHYFIVKAATD